MFPKGTHWIILYYRGKYFNWNEEKNSLLRKKRGVSFEEIIASIQNGGVLRRMKHPNQEKYRNQKICIVKMREYVYIVPYVESEHELFLKTIISSRKETRRYRGGAV